MSARRKSRPAVSLFEFLAVLVCAMGALILLLLVTTRRIRQQALEELNETEAPIVVIAVDEPDDAEPETEVSAVPLIVLATPDSDAPRWTVPETAWEPAPVPPAIEPDPYAEAVRQNEELRREWQTNVVNLESRRTTLEQSWQEWQATLAAANRVVQNLASQRLQLDNESRVILEQQAALDANAQRLHQSHAALTRQIDATAAQLQVVRNSPTPAASQYSILPYDYSTGTSRRPIIIECTANEIRFASESVFLSAEDIQGFTPSYNPLQAGAGALVQYWNQHDTEAGSNGDPYILLVVRPGGTISYYIARKLLESVGDRFGYELVGADQQFVWPESTPEATRLCREAVESCLADRNRVRERVGGGNLPLAGPLQFMDSRGNFYLDEVAELQGIANEGSNGGAQQPGSSGPDRGDLSAIFGAPVDSTRPGGASNSPEQPSGRTHQLHQPQGAGPSSQGEMPAGQPQQGQPQAGQQSSGQSNQGEGQGTQPQQGGNSPGSEAQGGNSGQDSGEGPQSPRQSAPANSPSWIERPHGPDRSPSYETHPGLFGGAGTGNAHGGQRSTGSTRPLVIETANPSGSGGVGDSGTSSSSMSPAPVVRGLNEPNPPQGTLGYQRDIYVYIDGTSFQVAGEQAVGITSSMSRDQVSALLAASLRSRMATWEAAPEGGTWVPRIRFEIRRGGNAHLRQMADIVSEWQINWSANYTSE